MNVNVIGNIITKNVLCIFHGNNIAITTVPLLFSSLLTVFLQQTTSNIEHSHNPGRCNDILPAIFTDVFREMASDDIISSNIIQ